MTDKISHTLLSYNANKLLLLQGWLASVKTLSSIERLRTILIQELDHYQQYLKKLRLDTEILKAADYILCTALDEAILATDWGIAQNWSSCSLLSLRHHDTWGGEKFFTLLEQYQKEPQKHIELLELFYLSLSQGFEGKYRLEEKGRQQLEAIRQRLFHTLSQYRSMSTSKLWDKPKPSRRHFESTILWHKPIIVAGSILLLVFIGMKWQLYQTTQFMMNHYQLYD